MQACGLVCSGYASIINCPNLVNQGHIRQVSYPCKRRGEAWAGPRLVCEFGTESTLIQPCAYRLCSSRVCRCTSFIRSSFLRVALAGRSSCTLVFFFHAPLRLWHPFFVSCHDRIIHLTKFLQGQIVVSSVTTSCII